MFFCSPLWLISASALTLKARTAAVVADNAMRRVLPLLEDDEYIFLPPQELMKLDCDTFLSRTLKRTTTMPIGSKKQISAACLDSAKFLLPAARCAAYPVSCHPTSGPPRNKTSHQILPLKSSSR